MRSSYARLLSSAVPQYKLPEQERESLLNQLTSTVGSGIEALGLALDTPGAIVRGILAGEPLSGFNFDFDKRVSGSELLESYGYTAPEEILGNKFLGRASDFATGLVTEIALDPLNLINVGASALTKAGRALGKTRYLDDIQRIAARKNIDAVIDAQRQAGAFSDAGAVNALTEELDLANRLMRSGVGKKTGRVVADRMNRFGIPATQGMREVAPPIGRRVAQATTTPRDVVKFAAETGSTPVQKVVAARKAKQEIDQAARALGSSFDEIADQTAGGLVRVGAGNLSRTFNPKGALPYLDALDSLMAKIRYSAPVIRAAPYFQRSVDGATSLRGQLNAMRRNQLVEKYTADMGVKIANHTAIAKQANEDFMQAEDVKALVGAKDLFDPNANDMLTRIAEGIPSAIDEKAIARLPSLQAWRDSWQSVRDDLMRMKTEAGIDTAEYGPDMFGVEWTPRQADEAYFDDYASAPKTRSRVAGVESEADMGRTIRTPGGTIDIREISQTPLAIEFANKFGTNTGPTEKEMFQHVKKELEKRHGEFKDISKNDEPTLFKLIDKSREASAEAGEKVEMFMSGDEISRIVGLLKRYEPENANRGIPLFSANPIKAQQRAMRGDATALANAEYVYETLADNAIRQRKTTIEGSGYKKLGDVTNLISKQLGFIQKTVEEEADGLITRTEQAGDKVVENIKNRLMQRLQYDAPDFAPDRFDLNEFSIPESVVNALTDRISSFVDPITKKNSSNFFNSFTALFKNTVLARPARFLRDLYSNAFTIYYETGSIPATVRGFRAAQHIIGGQPEKAFEYLKTLPQFQGERFKTVKDITDEIARQASSNQLLGGLASSDLFRQNSVLSISEYYPGAAPKTLSGILSENAAKMVPSEERTGRDIINDLFTIRGVGFGTREPMGVYDKTPIGFFGRAPQDTLNPFFRASEEIGDTVDSWARLGGWLALLSQGNSFEQAARRMKKGLVDYSTLTEFEREKFVRFWLPFWSYNSRIGAYVAQSIADKPGGRLAQTIRGFTNLSNLNDENYIPTSIRQNVGIKYASPSEGVDRYLTNFDLPGFDAVSILQPSQGFPFLPDVQGTMRNIALQLGPIPRGAMEIMSGVDTFTGRPLSEADTTAARTYKSLTGGQLSPLAKVVAGNFPPFQAFEPFLRPLLDERLENYSDRVNKFLMNYLTGVKVQDVDRKYRLRDQLNLLAPELESVTRTFPIQYVPQDQKALITPEQQRLLNLDADLRKLLKLEP